MSSPQTSPQTSGAPNITSPIVGFFNKTNAPLSLSVSTGGRIRLQPGEFVRDASGQIVNSQALLQYRPYGLEPKFREASAPVAPRPTPQVVTPPPRLGAAGSVSTNQGGQAPAADVSGDPEETTADLTESLRGGATLRVLDRAEITEADLMNPEKFVVIQSDGRYLLPLDNFVAREPAALKHHVKTTYGKEFAEQLKFPR